MDYGVVPGSVRVSPNCVRMGAPAFADAVLAATGDKELAAAVRAAGVTPWSLLLALPQLDAAADALLAAHKAALCHVAGLPAYPHRPLKADEAAPPPADRRAHVLHPAEYLRGARLRVRLSNVQPHFRRAGDGIACNGCAAEMAVHTHEALVGAVFLSAWHAYHWKTFLCPACKLRANRVPESDSATCRSCFVAGAAVALHPLCYATAADPTAPRLLPLCAPCASANAAQLATVAYAPPPDAMVA